MKKGVYYQEPIMYGLLFFIVILFFGIFLLTARNLESNIEDDLSVQKVASYDGLLAVQTYLRTPLSVDATRYLNGSATASYDLTIAQALPKVLEECIASESDFCSAFRKRSMLYMQSICQYDYVLLIQGKGALRLSPQGPKSFASSDSLSGFGGTWADSEDFTREGVLYAGEQTIPTTDGLITTRIACLARNGVDV